MLLGGYDALTVEVVDPLAGGADGLAVIEADLLGDVAVGVAVGANAVEADYFGRVCAHFRQIREPDDEGTSDAQHNAGVVLYGGQVDPIGIVVVVVPHAEALLRIYRAVNDAKFAHAGAGPLQRGA